MLRERYSDCGCHTAKSRYLVLLFRDLVYIEKQADIGEHMHLTD